MTIKQAKELMEISQRKTSRVQLRIKQGKKNIAHVTGNRATFSRTLNHVAVVDALNEMIRESLHEQEDIYG